MLRFAANLTFLFDDVPFLERFERAATAGFRAVEFLWPDDEEPRAVEAAARAAGVEVVLFNFAAGDVARGDRGIAADPAREAAFRENVPVALELARRVGCARVNALLGVRRPDLALEDQLGVARANVAWAAERARVHGIDVMVEPVNSLENGAYLLDTVEKAIAFMDAVPASNLALQCDLYHVQRMQGDLMTRVRRHIDRIGHVQIADAPDRREPGTGEIAYAYLLRELDALGYAGWVGLEYRPSTPTTEESLGWLRMLQQGGTESAHA